MLTVLPPRIQQRIIEATKKYYGSVASASLEVPEESKPFRMPGSIFLPYQKQVWQTIDSSQVTVIEKSRRIGISWLLAGWAAFKAARHKGNDVYFISYNYAMTEGFISDAAWFCKGYNLAASQIESEIIEDENKSILTFRIKFRSGFKIVALSSKPSNLRSKKGDIILDEAAFVDDLQEVLKAGLAGLIWGNKLVVCSTHNGIDNSFAQFCDQIKKKELDYSLVCVPFQRAIAEGLCKRVLEVRGETWTSEVEMEWVKSIYDMYGIGASEELDCQPLDIKGGGKVFDRDWFEIVDEIPARLEAEVRFWDLAATLNKNSYYTAGVRLCKIGEIYYVINVIADKLDPVAGDEFLLSTATSDGKKVPIRWELEGGSAGLKYEAYMQKELLGFDAAAVRPIGDKLTRAKPVAGAAKSGRIKLLRSHWNKMFLDAVHGFDAQPRPLINDITDALSGAYANIVSTQPFHYGATPKQRYDNSYGGMVGNWRDQI